MSTQPTERDEKVALLPPFATEDEEINRSVYLPKSLWERLSEIAEETKVDDPRGKGYSRNEVIRHALVKFAEDWERERSGKKRK